jgi:hypothetical protein
MNQKYVFFKLRLYINQHIPAAAPLLSPKLGKVVLGWPFKDRFAQTFIFS